jgi:3-methylcrotonyl-CoA carboxylase alpha subunit
VYSDADADAACAPADEAVHDRRRRAARATCAGNASSTPPATGAQAIHPGYGFLSENEDFAEACAAAGLVFIGPPPRRSAPWAARPSPSADGKGRRAAGAGLPRRPTRTRLLQREADRIGYPVLIKASAGGGGKGMRAVDKREDFAPRWPRASARRKRSFGDDHVLVEKYVQRPRHIEIQVFGDTPRQLRLPVRARLLGAAPPPEGAGGGAGPA